MCHFRKLKKVANRCFVSSFDVFYIFHWPKLIILFLQKWKTGKKTNTVRDYNNRMAGIDRAIRMLSYYLPLRKNIRWYKKLIIYILDVLLHYANIFYIANKTEVFPSHNSIKQFSIFLVRDF